MTAYEVTQELLAATSSSPATPAPTGSPRKRGPLRVVLTAGVAAGALLLAAPGTTALAVGTPPHHGAVSAQAKPVASTMPTTLTVTRARTGSVLE